jgi:hypothetical protein
MSQETIERTFEISASARLKLSNICGSVDIHPGEDNAIRVTAIKHTDSSDAERTEIEMSQAADGMVIVATHFREGQWMWLFGSRPCQVDYSVKAPRACCLKVNVVSSTVVAEGFSGEFDFDSVSGDVTLRDLTGPLNVRTVSGDLAGQRLSGPLDLNSVSGDVALSESTLPSVAATTVSGDLRLHTALGQGPYHFNSVSGDVRLTLPGDARCSTRLHSISGGISTPFPLTSYCHKNGSQVAEVQGGGVNVSLHSVSGDLLLDTDGKVMPTPTPQATPSVVDRREVLERIERGEMTVEEGLTQLRG